MKEKVSIITGASGEIGQNLILRYSKLKNKKIYLCTDYPNLANKYFSNIWQRYETVFHKPFYTIK